MEEIQKLANDLYESIEYIYFKKLAQDIDFFSNLGNEEKRIQLGILYNHLQGIKYEIKRLDLFQPSAKLSLKNLQNRFLKIKKEYAIITGKQLITPIAIM